MLTIHIMYSALQDAIAPDYCQKYSKDTLYSTFLPNQAFLFLQFHNKI